MQSIKEEAIKRHRLMWNWIAEETLKRNDIITEEDAIEHFNWVFVSAHSWCCDYALTKLRKVRLQGPFNGSKCLFCPINWGEKNSFCMNISSPFRAWTRIVDKFCYGEGDWYDIQDAAKYAKEIANLPEREMED